MTSFEFLINVTFPVKASLTTLALPLQLSWLIFLHDNCFFLVYVCTYCFCVFFFFFFFFLASLEWKLPEDESRSFCLLCSGLCPLRLQQCPAPLGAQETLVDWVQKIKFSKQQPHSPLVYILTLLNFSIQHLMLFIIVDFLILCLLSGIKPYKLSSCFCLLWRDNWT